MSAEKITEDTEDDAVKLSENNEQNDSDYPAQDGVVPEDGGGEQSASEGQESNSAGENTDDELIVTIGDDEAEETEKAPDWVKQLRKDRREDKKALKKANARIAELENGTEEELGERPTQDDFYDEPEKYDEALLAWHGRKTRIENRKKKAQNDAAKQEEDWESSLASYKTQKEGLGVEDFDDVEDEVTGSLSPIQQSIIIKGSQQSALLFLAIGKNKTVLDRLSGINDPIKFAVEVGKIEQQMRTRKGRKAPKPEKTIKGSGSKSGSNALDALREEAAKTGDYSKVIAYKRKQQTA